MGFSLKQMLTPPKSIRKFQPKKAGNLDWWKDVGKEVGVPLALGATGLGLAGMGPLSGALGGAGQAAGGSGILGKALNFAKGNPEMLLGGIDTIMNAKSGADSDKLRGKAVKQMQTQERTRADLLERALGMSASNPDLSAMFSDPSNPFSGGGGSAVQPTGGPSTPGPAPVDASGVKGFSSEAEAAAQLQKMGFPAPGNSTLGKAIGRAGTPRKAKRRTDSVGGAFQGNKRRAM